MFPGRWQAGGGSRHPQPFCPGGKPGPLAVEPFYCYAVPIPTPRSNDQGLAGPGPFRRDRRGGALSMGRVGRAATTAPSAGPLCTVSVKLQQLAGYRNLITQPCPFHTYPLFIVPGRLLREEAEQRQNGRKMGMMREDFVALGLCRASCSSFPGVLPPPSPLLETAILAP